MRCRPFQRKPYISVIGMPCRQAVSGELGSPSLTTKALRSLSAAFSPGGGEENGKDS